MRALGICFAPNLDGNSFKLFMKRGGYDSLSGIITFYCLVLVLVVR